MHPAIQIIYSDNGTGHEDLVLDMPPINLRVVADTYYLRILDNVELNDDDSRVKQALAILLEYWLRKISSLDVLDYCYLPFDYSDQYKGCLKVAKFQNYSLRISYGYSLVEGWSVDPLNPVDYTERVTDYRITSEEFDIKPEELVRMIKLIHDNYI